eukprot:Em0016g231a
MRVTSEIITACVNEKYPASVVQKATKKYFATLKRRSRLQTNNKLPDARNKQRIDFSELVINHLIAKLLEKEQQEQLKCETVPC